MYRAPSTISFSVKLSLRRRLPIGLPKITKRTWIRINPAESGRKSVAETQVPFVYSLTILGILSLVLSLLLTPLVGYLCRRWGMLDHSGGRKVHGNPVPRAGGAAVVLSYLLACTILIGVGSEAGEMIWSARADIFQLIPAAALVFFVGLLDDVRGLKAGEKLFGQTLAASAAYFAGVHVTAFGGHALAPWLSLPGTVLWLLACTNALNLIDGLDGLACGVGLFATATTLLAAGLQHNIGLALAVVPLLGALLGFLRFNSYPATIFLGDPAACSSVSCWAALVSSEPEVGHAARYDGASNGLRHSSH